MQYLDYNEAKQRGTFDFPIEIHHIDYQHPRYEMTLHWHIEYEIIRILQGEFNIFLDGQELTARKGDIIFIEDGVLHGGTPIDCIYECIVFDINMLLNNNHSCNKLIKQVINHSLSILNFFPDPKDSLTTAVNQLFESMIQQTEGFQFTTFGALYLFLGIIVEKNYYNADIAPNIRNHKRIEQLKQALELIETSYASTLTLEQLSKSAGMSPKYFCRFFQAMTHKTPIDYLNYYRIERSCYQLLTTDLSLINIAYGCGFNDFSYFIKTFKKYKGITPKKYINNI